MSSSAFGVDLLPHRPPMRLVEEIADLVAGQSARGLRLAHPDDWYFQGHFPGDPVVPAIVLVELLAQTGGLIAGGEHVGAVRPSFRIAALGPFKFPSSARPQQRLDAHARVAGRIGDLIKIEGHVLADGVRVAAGSVILADVSRRSSATDSRTHGRTR